MTNQNVQKKLTLNRETLATLDNTALEGVNGGATIQSIIKTIVRTARYTYAASNVINWVRDHVGANQPRFEIKHRKPG